MGRGLGGARCQVPGCKTNPINRAYYQVCMHHSTLPSLVIDGREQRWCQQCGRFHDLSAFDGDRRTCRAKLAHHNSRRKFARDRCRMSGDAQLAAVHSMHSAFSGDSVSGSDAFRRGSSSEWSYFDPVQPSEIQQELLLKRQQSAPQLQMATGVSSERQLVQRELPPQQVQQAEQPPPQQAQPLQQAPAPTLSAFAPLQEPVLQVGVGAQPQGPHGDEQMPIEQKLEADPNAAEQQQQQLPLSTPFSGLAADLLPVICLPAHQDECTCCWCIAERAEAAALAQAPSAPGMPSLQQQQEHTGSGSTNLALPQTAAAAGALAQASSGLSMPSLPMHQKDSDPPSVNLGQPQAAAATIARCSPGACMPMQHSGSGSVDFCLLPLGSTSSQPAAAAVAAAAAAAVTTVDASFPSLYAQAQCSVDLSHLKLGRSSPYDDTLPSQQVPSRAQPVPCIPAAMVAPTAVPGAEPHSGLGTPIGSLARESLQAAPASQHNLFPCAELDSLLEALSGDAEPVAVEAAPEPPTWLSPCLALGGGSSTAAAAAPEGDSSLCTSPSWEEILLPRDAAAAAAAATVLPQDSYRKCAREHEMIKGGL